MSEARIIKKSSYNPDVLSCLANLSNDEVFTPPEVANAMLDLLPPEIFSDPNARFLDPACKSGVFLREIAKRLNEGLKDKIPDLQERVQHIFTKQLYAIAITELTSLLGRRSVYCSKDAGSKYSVAHFESSGGNIFYSPTKHLWINGKCLHCGASQSEYSEEKRAGLESHAYQFIHNAIPGEIENMKFDVIIGNPPYQMGDGGNGASAKPIYHLFIQQAKKLTPRFLVMIIPARWYAGGKGLDDFRDEMLNDNRLRIIHDFNDASECFSGVEIKGGVCYFRWDRDSKGLCKVYQHSNDTITSKMERPLLEDDCDVFIRHNQAISILRKVKSKKEQPFSSIVSSRKPFGLATNFTDFSATETKDSVKIYANQKQGFVKKNLITDNYNMINAYKLFIPEAIGAGDMTKDWIKPIMVGKNICCTETYLAVGPFNDEKAAENAFSYTQTKFFHLLLGLKKITQHTTSKVYSFVPLQDFTKNSDIDWSKSVPEIDRQLYAKYSLTDEEVAFIESMIRPME